MSGHRIGFPLRKGSIPEELVDLGEFPGGAIAAPAGWPESCWDGPSKVGNGWMARCDAGTGKYQAVVFCQVILGGQKLVRQGGWTHAGTWATAFCPGGTNRTSGGINSSPDP